MNDKVVKCPWCGRAMALFVSDYVVSGKIHACYQCYDCEVDSPSWYGATGQEAIEAAYLAATATPPNLPLTREQVEAMDDLDAVWVNEMGIKTYVHSGEWVKDFLRTRGLQGYCMFKYFARKPTPADIEAARKERTHDHP